VHGSPVTASLASSCVGLSITTLFVILFGEAEAQDILVTSSLLPAVLGYALLMECIVNIRRMETLKESTPTLTARLGEEPGPLRFQYGIIGARLVQLMCALLFGSLLYLASNSLHFIYGFILLFLLGFLILSLLLMSSAKKTPLNVNEIFLQFTFFFRQIFQEAVQTKLPSESDYELMDTSISRLVPMEFQDGGGSRDRTLDQELVIHLQPHDPPLSYSGLRNHRMDGDDLVL
jgi:hypothetical protein